jgi:hypothetical protein
MKHIACLILLVALFTTARGQISPDLKTGIGYSYVLDQDDSKSPNYHTIKGYPTVSVEKPFPVQIRLKKRMSINPGVAYYFFKQERYQEYEKATKDFNLNHQSLNVYSKVLYQAKFAGKTEAFMWGGGIAGINLITKTKGTKTVYGLNENIPEYTDNVNQNGKEFFDFFYYGALIGFQPNARRYNTIKPSFELAYFPNFVQKPNETEQITYSGIGTIQFTVFLGIRIR